MADEPTKKPYSVEEIEPPNFPRAVGKKLNDWMDLRRPMGSWTGLPIAVGAPASGALWGAGAGALYGLYRKLMAKEDEKPGMLTPLLVGAGVGAGLGGLAAFNKLSYYQGSSSDDALDKALRAIRNDRSLSDAESARVIHALRMAQGHERKRLLAMAAAGTLTGVIASRILGVGLLGSALAGFGAARIVGNHMRPKFYV